MCKILQIETATQVCSVALAVNGTTIAFKELAALNIHASNLTLFIEEVMHKGQLSYQDLDAIAVSKGPGSYTGLRIGVSTAKGLCFALDKPLIAIDTLKMMANGFLRTQQSYSGLVCPMIDARRMEVFTAVYNAQLDEVNPVQAKIVDKESFEKELATNLMTFIGDGAAKCADTLIHLNAKFDSQNYNSALNMNSLALAAFNEKSFEDVAYFEPFYLKDFVLTSPKAKV